ncbi:MAG TPA: glutamine-hydrolyzing GMP synthase [Polyangia bacterium]|nr:glutamine-hydrolyzing GMP synthase [Polyangia bacterium]
MEHDAIAVIDFGGQYAHLIATKVRRYRVLAEILQPDDPIERFRPYKGIIISGSPSLSSHGEDSAYTKEIYDLPVPILGFCFGHQELAKHYGGEVIHGGREWGRATLHVVREHPLFAGLGREEQVWMSHFDSVAAVGPAFEELGWSDLGEAGTAHRFAAIGSDSLRRYGFQFHPEVDDTRHGGAMIANFVLGICDCAPTWTMEGYLEEQLERIRRQVGDGSVFLLASGGVDSTVAAVLLGRALGPDRLHLLHVDNGLMRKAESRGVLERFAELGLGSNLHFVDATADFLRALEGLIEPEDKRRAIGQTFVDVFEREARRLGIEGHLLGQGTIYPDTIETGGTRRADTIKTHHNRVPVIERMIAAGRVIEPLADLYKVEVRELAEKLGIPREDIWRHPFPGPGLGVRLLCCAGGAVDDGLDGLQRRVDAFLDGRGAAGLVLPLRSVGVKADLRSYEHPVLLSSRRPWPELSELTGKLLAEVEGLNRCVWNLGPDAPKTARAVAGTMTRERLDLLREADHLVMEGLRRHGIYDEIWQCPTALVPLEIDGRGREFIIVRPIHSERAMTAVAARFPDALVDELRASIGALPGISGLGLDLTAKPPGTIEWE